MFFIKSRVLVIIAIATSLFMLSSAIQHHSLAVFPPVTHVSTDQKYVALTFDDGPDPPFTTPLLNLLKLYNAKATFFLVAPQVEYYPQLARQIVLDDNEVANHSYNHFNFRGRPSQAIRTDVAAAQEIIQKATGIKPTLFRFPYGKYDVSSLRTVEETGLIPINWDVDSLDWKRLTPKAIANRILLQIKPGSIVLLHDGGGFRQSTVNSLKLVLPALRQNGYHMVTVSQLLHLRLGRN